MIHFLPESAFEPASAVAGEASARLAGLKRALRLVDPWAGPAPDVDPCDGITVFFSGAVRSCFDRRSEFAIHGAAAGLEAIAASQGAGDQPNQSSLDVLAADIRRALADLSSLVRA